MPSAYPLEPQVTPGDFRWLGGPSWDAVDALVAGVTGQPGVAVPSVRVGLCWVMDHLGYRRHKDHVLVPRFVGRCILNSVNRFALPVEEPTSRTRAAIVVDQFGRRQEMSAIAEECAARGYLCIEDSPCGFGVDERPFKGSLARLIGFSKALPVAQGAFLVSSDEALLASVRKRRAAANVWSRIAWLAVWNSRRAAETPDHYSALLNAAYELYPDAGGGARWIRTNLDQVFQNISQIARVHETRLQRLRDLAGAATLFPTADRLAYVVPYMTSGDVAEVGRIFESLGFNGSRWHVDLNRNLFTPRYETAFLIPVNSRIPEASFEALVSALHLHESRGTAVAPPEHR